MGAASDGAALFYLGCCLQVYLSASLYENNECLTGCRFQKVGLRLMRRPQLASLAGTEACQVGVSIL